MRCFLVELPITEKYWRRRAKGNSKNSILTERSQCFFVETKLQKKLERKAVAAKNIQIFNLKFKPVFANTVLAEVFFDYSFSIVTKYTLLKWCV